MLDSPASRQEVSRKLWTLLGGLVEEQADTKHLFANVPRHSGFEAWRRIAELINDDKALVCKELLPKLPNPRHATRFATCPRRSGIGKLTGGSLPRAGGIGRRRAGGALSVH